MPVTEEPHSAREKEREHRETDRKRGRDRKGESGGVGESRGHVNRYMFETQIVFIDAVMHREMGR